jgi:hypothetical protein
MGNLSRTLPILFLCWTTVLATLPASYDVVWDKPGVNGSADSMPLGGGDIGLNTWYENGKPALNMYPPVTHLSVHIVAPILARNFAFTDTPCNRHYPHVRRQERDL